MNTFLREVEETPTLSAKSVQTPNEYFSNRVIREVFMKPKVINLSQYIKYNFCKVCMKFRTIPGLRTTFV